ncbi:MAG: hypothetical protein A3E87_10895 [Gammaproteobacteria bacterium RIFCSPHIGHO2_12_FULL_35_23]|nr:MAG: hypothetical protein A3E87_10895 [Gammaproteobacteria bacterium RIFCSPHIGHO2_12_FULL_35_23]
MKINVILFPVLLAAYEAITYLSNDAYLPALPNITHDLASSQHLIQLTLTTWFLGSASMQIILGPIADRFGRRIVLLTGGIIFIIATLVCALTSSINTLLLFRYIQGATIPSMIVAGYATIYELYDHETAIHTLAWMNSLTLIAPSLGPLFGALLLPYTGWRWIFGLLSIMAGLIIIGLYFKMPETNSYGKNAIQLSRILKEYGRILSNANYMKSVLSSCFLLGAIIAWIAAGPFLVMTQFHYSPLTFGILQALIFGCFIVGTQTIKPLMKKIKSYKLASFGINITFYSGLLALVTTWFFTNTLISLIIPMMLLAWGSGLYFPILNRISIETSNEPMGARIAVFSTLMSGFAMLSSALISGVYNGTSLSLAIFLAFFSTIAYLLKLTIPQRIIT